jgi:NTP pyrophosphatase (non-canonical NTP hydrolase)
MELNLYQYKAREFILPSAYSGSYLFPGLAAEAGEVCGKYAKYIRDSYGVADSDAFYNTFKDDVQKELGDVLWFVAMLGDFYGFTLNDIGHANIAKLQARKEKGTIQGSGDNR